MTALPAAWWPAVIAFVLAVSPLLAGWTAALAAGVTAGWWRPRRTGPARRAVAAVVTSVLTAAGISHGVPWLAWLLFAAAGGVLLVVDIEVHRLPARLLNPLAAAEAAILTVTAVTGGDPSPLVRAGLAAAVVGAGWLLLVFLAPAALGLGDVRLLAVTAGLLGWISWPAVVAGQLLAFVLAALSAPLVAAVHRTPSWRALQVPMGPAIVVATVLTSYLL